MTKEKYKWMKPYQKSLYQELCKEFNFKKLTDIGVFLQLKNPYHGAKLIFEAKKQNIYLRKLVEEKKRGNDKISSLINDIELCRSLYNNIDSIEIKLQEKLESLKRIKQHVA